MPCTCPSSLSLSLSSSSLVWREGSCYVKSSLIFQAVMFKWVLRATVHEDGSLSTTMSVKLWVDPPAPGELWGDFRSCWYIDLKKIFSQKHPDKQFQNPKFSMWVRAEVGDEVGEINSCIWWTEGFLLENQSSPVESLFRDLVGYLNEKYREAKTSKNNFWNTGTLSLWIQQPTLQLISRLRFSLPQGFLFYSPSNYSLLSLM